MHLWRKQAILAAAIIALGLVAAWPVATQARTVSGIGFPRIANIFLKTPITSAERTMLAQWDLVILGMQAQDTDPTVFQQLRAANPDILILAYVAPADFPLSRLNQIESPNGPWHKLEEGIQSSWWLRHNNGDIVSWWPGNQSLNVTSQAPAVNGERWNTYLPQFLHDEVMSTGKWDGIFYDNVWSTIDFAVDNNVDLNRDGQADNLAIANALWLSGMTTMLRTSRQLEGPEAILLGNGGDSYSAFLNGRMFESFPSNYEGGWEGQTRKYFSFMNNGFAPPISFLNTDTGNTGNFTDYRHFRFGLTSALLHNGFYSFDWGTQDHSQVWWYDEYDLLLGDPLGSARNLNALQSSQVFGGLWRRDFAKGVVFSNSTASRKTVQLETGLYRFAGTQDRTQNSGQSVTSLTLEPFDGIILLKRFQTVSDQPVVNNQPSQAVDRLGRSIGQPFYVYDANFPANVEVIKSDLDANGTEETVVGRLGAVQTYDRRGVLIGQFIPYPLYRGQIHVAVGDIEGDGRKEIITGTGAGAGPQVRIFRFNGQPVGSGFFAYAPNVRTGVNVAVGDLNGDGRDEIITGAGPGGGSHVRAFTRFGKPLASFFAYDPRFRGGVNVAVGDLNGDGRDEIITGAGPGGGPHVRAFNRFGRAVIPGFFAASQQKRGGVRVAAQDVNNDGRDEIIVSTK